MNPAEGHVAVSGRNGGSRTGRLPCSRTRVLAYHRVAPPDSYVRPRTRTLTADNFRRHLELLEKWGYTPITFADHALICAGELLPPKKPIILTFDGGYADVYNQAFPILQEFGMHAVVFVTADPAQRQNGWEPENPDGSAPLLSPEELLHLHDAGFEIGSLSMTHQALPLIPRDDAWGEILHSRMRLEGLLNAPVRTFAYPYGLHNATLKSLVRDAGYHFACTTWSGPGKFLEDPFAIRRIEVSDSLDPLQFALKVRGPYPNIWPIAGRSREVLKHSTQARTLLLVSSGLGWPGLEEMKRREAEDLTPRRTLILSALHADVANERFLSSAPLPRRLFYRVLPFSVAQLFETSIVGGQYDAIVSWAERIGIPLAILLKISGAHFPHVGIFSWISRPKKAIPLWFARSRFDRLILMSSRQRDFALQTLRLPPEKITFLRWPVDQKFWRPEAQPADTICAVGREMRDYATLVEALRGSAIPCHIAAGGQGARKKDPWINTLSRADALPTNVTVGPKNFLELRDLYRRSLFVVMPLLPTKTDNGTTTILEAMAMGKAVICSQVEGQRDVIRDGETGLFVPPQDPVALRQAIEHLWNHPEEAERMGKAARAHIEEYHTLDAWVAEVRRAVESSILAHRPENNGEGAS